MSKFHIWQLQLIHEYDRTLPQMLSFLFLPAFYFDDMICGLTFKFSFNAIHLMLFKAQKFGPSKFFLFMLGKLFLNIVIWKAFHNWLIFMTFVTPRRVLSLYKA